MIFEDPSRKRWLRTRLVFLGMFLAFIFLMTSWGASLIVSPPLPSFIKKHFAHSVSLKNQASLLKKEMQASSTSAVKLNKSRVVLPKSFNSTSSLSLGNLNPGAVLSTAFLIQDDADSLRSLREHGQSLDIVFPDWYFITEASCSVDEREDKDVTKIISENGHAAIFPRVANVKNGLWLGDEFGKIIKTEETRHCLATTLTTMLASTSAKGINLDIENLALDDRDNYLEFLIDLTTQMHQKKLLVTIDVPARDQAFDYEYIGRIVDGVVLMSYDEHYAGGQPGPIASEDWFNDTFTEVAAAVPVEKLIVALGAYGYDWTGGSKKPALSLRFDELMELARDVEAEPSLESTSKNMFFAYQDDQKKEHQVWFMNGVTAWNEFVYLHKKNVLGYSLWRLGTEDPSVWQINDASTTGDSFASAPAMTSVRYQTEGEFFQVHSSPQAGSMEITLDETGGIDFAQYHKLPSGWVMDRVGQAMPAKGLVLTFDDGPDNVWTPQILDVLKKNNVPAVFFLVGDQAQKYPEIISRMAREGFLVGNHTYLHPDISTISDNRIKLELNRTARYIETAYGRKTALFRPPYNTDTTPTSPEQLRALKEVNALGYAVVGANIDSGDWERPGVEQIIKNVTSQVAKPDNHVIVMHDAGGDRAQTVSALAKLIPLLRAQGYNFLSLEQASGLSREMLMPKLESKEWFFIKTTELFYFLKGASWTAITWLFLLTTIISIARLLFMGNLVLRSIGHFKEKKKKYTLPDELVTVLVPAYNEEMTIGRTLEALQKSTYDKLEILVIDDGSKDKTAQIVLEYQKQDGRIRLIQKENGGKSSAANLGLQEAKGRLVVAIDADTITYPFTIGELITPFSDPKVDAVCGNVEVGNIHSVLTGFQALEYITSQNFDRRAFDELNCISVVPGATGAWRRDKVLEIGGYSDDTLTEDADLTLRLLVSGGRVVYAPEARSRTEAPETVSALAKQRFRWSFGTFQCLRKNSKQFFHGSLGWVALPNMFMFQVLFPILSPIGDLVLVLAIFRGDVRSILAGYLMFIMMDVFGSLLAFSLEKRSMKLMWLILIQRFFYRQFMYVITYRAIMAIFKGRRHGWNKLERLGTVKMS